MVVISLASSANRAKTRWNAANYKQVKISVPLELAATFKSACAAANVSMSETLMQFMAKYAKTPAKRKPEYATRRQRRAAILAMSRQFEQILDSEERCRDAIPENLQGSVVYETADQIVSSLEEAL